MPTKPELYRYPEWEERPLTMFDQDDLESDCLHLLFADNMIFIWQGSLATEEGKADDAVISEVSESFLKAKKIDPAYVTVVSTLEKEKAESAEFWDVVDSI